MYCQISISSSFQKNRRGGVNEKKKIEYKNFIEQFQTKIEQYNRYNSIKASSILSGNTKERT